MKFTKHLFRQIMQCKKNAKPKSLFDTIKESCRSLFHGPTKRKPDQTNIPQKKLDKPSSTVTLQPVQAKRLEKPLIQSNTIECSYIGDYESWENLLEEGAFVGVIGNSSFSELKIPKQCYQIIISDTSEINSLANLRPHCFEYIFTVNSDRTLLKKIFKSRQTVMIRATSDHNLKGLLLNWESIIEQQCLAGELLKSIICKLQVSIYVVNGNYWVSFNKCNPTLLNEAITKLGITSEDSLPFRRMKNGLTARQFFELKKIQKNEQQNFSRNTIIDFLLSNNLVTDEEMAPSSPSLDKNPLCPDADNLLRLSSTDFLKLPETASSQWKLGTIKSRDSQNQFTLHLLDRYQGISGEDDRCLYVEQPFKEKRYRTRSCCIQSLPSGDVDFGSQQFYLDI